jgi:Holliday junction resolvase RusA-like endonuclease
VYTGRVALAEGGSSVKGRAATKAWRALMTQTFRDQWAGQQPMTGPLALRVTFTVPRPRGHWRTGRNAHLLRDTAPRFPDVKPDGGKFQRAVEDSLTDAGVWSDDALVVFWHGAKLYPLDNWAQSLSGLTIPDPTVFCGVPTADALTKPGVVVRVWHV